MIIGWLLAQALGAPAAPPHGPAPTTTPGQPVAAVGLAPGESIIVRVAADGTVALVDGYPGARPPGPGEVRIDLRAVSGRTTLVVANNSPRFLLYRAAIARTGADRPQATSVCPVLPDGKFGIENWPYAISRVILYAMHYDEHPPLVCR